MITGARQVGKSTIVEEFANKHFKHFIKMDFIKNEEYVTALSGTKSTDEILLRLSSLFGDEMVPGETLIFFDEVQGTDHADKILGTGRQLYLYSQRLLAWNSISGYSFRSCRLYGYLQNVPSRF